MTGAESGRAAHPHTLQDRVEYVAFRALAAPVRRLPAAVGVGLGSSLGWFTGSVVRVRRAVVEANLERAFPDRPPAWRRRVAVAAYRHLGTQAAVMLRMETDGIASMRDRCEVRGLDRLTAAMDAGSVLLVTGHLGNWEMIAPSLAARGIEILTVAARQRNRLFDEDLARVRRRVGLQVVYRGGATAKVMASLDARRPVLLAADQDAGAGGVFVDFLGTPASTTSGPAQVAARSGARLLGCFCLAAPGGRTYRMHIEDLDVERSGDLAVDVERITRAHTALLGAWVRRAPEQYFWFHRRWKSRPPTR